MAAAFLIVLTFMAGLHQEAEHTIGCRDWPCVEMILAAIPTSTRLARVRVFEADGYGRLPLGGTVFPPLLDWWPA